ncbi:MAG: LysR family transcriptional regulator [Rhodospirillales bacterium]|nr:LysR family transcriptional regulator [Rhodospirillales bacterium]
MTIEPAPLRTVIAAAEHGSFRRAAAALDVKQSTLSRRVRRFEEFLGVKLFERSSGGVHVTAAGGDVVRTARRLIEQMERMVSTARSAGRGEAGDLTIGVCTSLSASKLRTVLAGYVQTSPRIEINIVEQSRARLLDGLRIGGLDIAIIAGEVRDHNGPSMLLWSERIIVALPTGHRLTSNEMIYWTDLKGESFLLSRRDPGPDLCNLIVQKLSAPGDAPKIAIWDVSGESVLSMLEIGHRISVHCESCARLIYPGVVYREVRDASGPSYVSFTACWDDANKSPALARFVDLLRKHHQPTLVT